MLKTPVVCSCLALALLLLVVAGCGKKTDPRPPAEILPAPITDLSFSLDESGVALSWTVPRRTVRGARLPYRVKEFELYRAVVPEEEYRPEQPPSFGTPLTVANDVAAGERLVFREVLLRPEHRYIYRVKSRAGWWLTGAPSNQISFTWLTPPTPPRELTVTAEDRRNLLRWRAPVEVPALEGRPTTLQYQVYRSEEGEDFRRLATVTQPSYVDAAVVGGRTYYYRVRARAVVGESRIAGPVGETLPVVARDLTPPPAPTLEALVPVRDGVRLLWEMPGDGELGEIIVLRRLAGEEEGREIARLAVPALSYVDRSPPPADTWFYRLISVDALGNRSEAGNELRFDRP